VQIYNLVAFLVVQMLKNGILESKVFSFEKNQYIIELDLSNA
jgi:hypothetical protein